MTVASPTQPVISRAFLPLVPAVPLDEFMTRYWELRHLRADAAIEDEWTSLLSVATLWKTLTSNTLRFPSVRVYEDGRPVDESEFTYTWRYGGEEFPHVIDGHRVQALASKGATVIFQSLEQHFDGVTALCRSYETLFQCPVQANAFYTPPDEQGVAAHYDSTDVFVLQVDGSKEWKLWGFYEELASGTSPYFQSRLDEYAAENPFRESFTLRAGEFLYLPRGMVHQASSAGNGSLHIAFILHSVRWSSVLKETIADILESLSESIRFRGTFVPEYSCLRDVDLPSKTVALDEVFSEVFENLHWGRVSRIVRQRVRAQAFTNNSGRLVDVIASRNISPASKIRLRPQNSCDVEFLNGTIRLHCSDRIIDFPRAAQSALMHVLAGHELAVRELRGILSLESKCLIAKTLVLNGVCALTN